MRQIGWLGLVLAACGGKDEEAPAPVEMSFVTFNTGLARGFVPGTESRVQANADAVGALTADVVCLQEVWIGDDLAAFEAAAGGSYPHRYAAPPQQSSDAFCDDGRLDTLLTCIDDNCADTCDDELSECLFDNCAFPFVALPKDCMRCAMANVGESVETVVENCEVNPGEYAYGGSFGLALFSRFPIQSSELLVLPSTSNRRGVIRATLDAPDGPLDVYCTHLTAAFDTIPYPRDEGNWVEEQAEQIRTMNDWIDGHGASRAVLLGDMNTGPAVGSINAEVPENWSIFESYGWDVPFLDAEPSCTYCFDNPLVGAVDDSADRLIDHVMLRGFEGPFTARLLLDAWDIDAESCGTAISPSALSDHYAVEVVVGASAD